MIAALFADWLKLRRARLLWITLLAATVGTVVGRLFVYVSINPERARALGLLSVPKANWPRCRPPGTTIWICSPR